MTTMFHKAVEIEYLNGTEFRLTFMDGKVVQYDISLLFSKYPQLTALKDRELFTRGRLFDYGIIWNDDLDLEVETVYQGGVIVRDGVALPGRLAAYAVLAARTESGLTQKELASRSGIDQSDISKIERGVANPSVGTLTRLADALGASLSIQMTFPTSTEGGEARRARSIPENAAAEAPRIK